MRNFSHTSVLQSEVIENLKIGLGNKFIDATLGGGGHAKAIIEKGGLVLGIDQDQDALEHVEEDQQSNIKDQKLMVAKGNFRDIEKIANDRGFDNVRGVLFDLGVSSYQLDEASRGFSFLKDERLDMRMDKSQKLTAYEVVNEYPKSALIEIFYRYGEEHNAEKVAQAIAEHRKKREIRTTKELSEIVGMNTKGMGIHPATRVFQAIRIEVNDELGSLKSSLNGALRVLGHKGRIAVISFHSLEDRQVKQAFDRFEKENMGRIITKKPITASLEEIRQNKRSRSAKLRVFEKN